MRVSPLQTRHRKIALGLAIVLATAMLAPAAQAAFPIEPYLQIRGASAGIFTPDGREVIFASAITGVPQLWRVPRQGGWPEQMTFFDDAVRGAKRSPRGDWLLFTKDTGGDERTQLYLIRPNGTGAIALTANPKAIHTFGGWSPDGKRIAYASNERNVAFFDIYVMDIASRRTRRVLTHDGTNYPVAWAPDGKSLVFTRVDTPSNENLHLVDLVNGKTVMLTTHQGNANYSVAGFGRDGQLYVASDQGREFSGLARLDIRHGQLNFISPDTADVEGVELTERGDRVAYLTNRGGYSDAFILPLGAGRPARPERVAAIPPGVVSNLDWSPDGVRLAITFTDATHPYDVWTYDTASRRLSQTTHSTLAGLPAASFVSPTLVDYPSFDGRRIPAFLYLPRGAKKDGKLPVLVYVHGGPEGQERPDFASSFQYYLNRGYGMLALNIRGSTGYGKTYTHLDDVRKRMDAVRDVEYAVKWLGGAGYADPQKLAIMGGSYGGYMTLACLTMLPGLWAAGVDTVGMSNLVSFLENTGPWRRPLREAEYGSLANDREFLIGMSPIHHVAKIQAPLLVIQGANDPRVPKTEADQIVDSLTQRHHPVQYMLFEDEGHGVAKLKNRIKTFKATADFLDRYVKKDGAHRPSDDKRPG